MNPQFFYLAGLTKTETAYFPVKDITSFTLIISTRWKNIRIVRDGYTDVAYPTNKSTDAVQALPSGQTVNYSSKFSGSIKTQMLGGLSDVYSIAMMQPAGYNIENFEEFISQFKDLYSYRLNIYSSSPDSVLIGNLLTVPNTVQRIWIQNTDVISVENTHIDFDGLPKSSSLEWLKYEKNLITSGKVKVKGDLANLPVHTKYILIKDYANGSAITYTGKTWPSEFDTISIHLPLNLAENDLLLNDMARDISTKIGDGIIYNTHLRTIASDNAAAQLTARGFTVKIPKINSYLLQMPLAANLIDVYGHNATSIGAETHEEGGLRTKNNQAAFIPQTTDLDVGTNSVHFGCTFKIKNLTSIFGLVGKSIAAGTNGRYALFVESGLLYFLVQDVSSRSVTTAITTFNDGNFHKVEGIYDRTRGFMSLLVDGVQVGYSTIPISSNNITCSGRFHIGAYGNASGTAPQPNFFFDGIIKDVFFNKF